MPKGNKWYKQNFDDCKLQNNFNSLYIIHFLLAHN